MFNEFFRERNAKLSGVIELEKQIPFDLFPLDLGFLLLRVNRGWNNYQILAPEIVLTKHEVR